VKYYDLEVTRLTQKEKEETRERFSLAMSRYKELYEQTGDLTFVLTIQEQLEELEAALDFTVLLRSTKKEKVPHTFK
jgi:hypothetical protein